MLCVLCRRKSVETSLALTQMFEAVIMRELYPQSKIDIYVQVLQSDGGTHRSAIEQFLTKTVMCSLLMCM